MGMLALNRFRCGIVLWALLLAVSFARAEDPVYIHGKFVRADLVTDDLKSASAFYSKLFGWRLINRKDHTLIISNEHELGSIVERERPQDTQAKPRWIAFMSVSDVAATQQKAITAGGEVLLGARDMQSVGIAALLADPQGAVFGVIRNKEGDPEDYIAEVGSWIWIELFARDAKKAGSFYADIGNYEIWDYEPQSTILQNRTNLLLVSDGYARAAVTELAKERAQAKPMWLPFVRVSDINQTLSKAQESGGRIVVAPSANALDGRVAVLADPRGAIIGIMEWSEDTSLDEDEQP